MCPEGTGEDLDLPINTGQNEAFPNRYPDGYIRELQSDHDEVAEMMARMRLLNPEKLQKLLNTFSSEGMLTSERR